MTDITKRRDEQAKNHVDSLTTELVHSFPFTHIEHAYCKGWDARDAIANEQLAELKEDIRLDRVKPDDYRELIEQNKALKAQVDNIRAHLLSECKNHNETFAERDSLKEQLKAKDAVIDVAMLALEKIKLSDYKSFLKGLDRPTEFALSNAKGMTLNSTINTSSEALEQIQKMRGGG